MPWVAPFDRLTSTSRMLAIRLETSFSAELVVDSNPWALPNCWLALVSAPTEERTDWATA